jgi:hypothetical protein
LLVVALAILCGTELPIGARASGAAVALALAGHVWCSRSALVELVWRADGSWAGLDARGRTPELQLGKGSFDLGLVLVLVLEERRARHWVMLERGAADTTGLQALRARLRLLRHRPADTSC